jgi:hypothetical protein
MDYHAAHGLEFDLFRWSLIFLPSVTVANGVTGFSAGTKANSDKRSLTRRSRQPLAILMSKSSWSSNRMVLTICLAFSGCAVAPPQTPTFVAERRNCAFESVIRYELARLRFPQHQTVCVEALEIFPNEPAQDPLQVQMVSHRLSNYKIIVTSKQEFPTRLWMQVHLTSTDGTTYLVYVTDEKNAGIFSLQKRGNSWVVVGVGPIIIV